MNATINNPDPASGSLVSDQFPTVWSVSRIQILHREKCWKMIGSSENSRCQNSRFDMPGSILECVSVCPLRCRFPCEKQQKWRVREWALFESSFLLLLELFVLLAFSEFIWCIIKCEKILSLCTLLIRLEIYLGANAYCFPQYKAHTWTKTLMKSQVVDCYPNKRLVD